MVEAEARERFAYDNAYNAALQQIVYTALSGTEYECSGDRNVPSLFSYSTLIPPRDARKGETRRLIFASHEDDLAWTIGEWLYDHPDIDVREMPLHVTKQPFQVDTPIDERGTLQSGTPIIIRLDEALMDQYGIESDHDRPYWSEEHGNDVFTDALQRNLKRKYRAAFGEEPPEPPYFTEKRMQRSVGKPLWFEGRGSVMFVGSEWTLEYETRNSAHQRLLSLVLDAGLGEYTDLGFGFTNRQEDVTVGSDSPDS